MAGIGRIIAFAFLPLAACGPSVDHTGVWVGRRDLATQPGADPVVAATLAKVRLQLRPDGRFDLFDRGMPVQGGWTGGPAAKLTVDQEFDRRLGPSDRKRSYLLQPEPDGTARLISEGESVALHRESQPTP